MDDTISRQAATQTALEFIVEYLGGAFDEDLQRKLVERISDLPSAQPDLIADIQNGIKATNTDDAYSCGMRNGMRWCISLIDGKEPVYDKCPPAQPTIEKTVEGALGT